MASEYEPVLDCKVLTFDVAKIAKPIKQCLLQVGVGGRATRAAFETPLMEPVARNRKG